jgi:hypothetical protein
MRFNLFELIFEMTAMIVATVCLGMQENWVGS